MFPTETVIEYTKGKMATYKQHRAKIHKTILKHKDPTEDWVQIEMLEGREKGLFRPAALADLSGEDLQVEVQALRDSE